MKFDRSFLTASVACILLSLVGVASAALRPQRVDFDSLEPDDYVPGELLVQFAPGVSLDDCKGIHVSAASEVKRTYRIIPWQLVRVDKRYSLQSVADTYLTDSRILHVEPNYRVHAIETEPNDARFGELWGMERINATEAWDITTGNSNIVVAVIDTGIRRDHEDLAANMWTNPDEIAGNGVDDDGNGYIDDIHGWDFVNDDNDPTDDQGHGTHCAGTIGAVGDNFVGVAGVCWNVKLVALKFLSASGSGSTADALSAVEYATGLSRHIKLTSNSWGGGGASVALQQAIEASAASNQLFIAAAGNSSTDNDTIPHYPSSYESESIIAVASIQVDGNLSGFSCYGETSVDIAAPGSAILSSVPSTTNSYDVFSGTSMATPHVAGAAALLWGMEPEAPWEQIRDAIYNGGAENAALVGKMTQERELDLLGALRELGASMSVDRVAYQSDALVRISVTDPQVTGAVASVDVAWETVDAGSVAHASGIVSLTPSSPGAQDFLGSLQLETGVNADHDDTLTLSYTGLNARVISVAVPIDDVAPVISSVTVTNVSDTVATLVWDTDESSDSYGLADRYLPPDTGNWQGSSVLVDWGVEQASFAHRVTLQDLFAQQRYFYAVRSTDAAGNTATVPVDLTLSAETNYPSFVTLERANAFQDYMDSGEGRWTHAGLDDCWEYGLPTSGPGEASTGTNCWATFLSGDYNDLMNAWLVSQPVWVGANPYLRFNSWHAIESGADFGVVEVNGGEGWINVTDEGFGTTLIDGESDGWQAVELRLPETLANRTIETRFRLQSNRETTYAGWYLDDFSVHYTYDPGLGIRDLVLPADDSLALSGGNDDDGFPEPGETADVKFEMMNTDSTLAFTGVTATVDCPSESVTIVDGYDTLDFGTVEAAAPMESTDSIRIILDSDAASFDDPITFFFHIEADGGYSAERTFSFGFAERDTIEGSVSNTVGTPIEDAVVTAVAADGTEFTARTDANGDYILAGLLSGVPYDLQASRTAVYSPSDWITTNAPASDVDFILGKAYADLLPDSVDLTLRQYDQAVVSLAIANTNASSTMTLQLDPSSDFDGETVAVSYTPSGTVTVPPGGVTLVAAEIAINWTETGTTNGNLTLTGNAVAGTTVSVPVSIYVVPGPALSLTDAIADDADDDGFVETGEAVSLDLTVANYGAAESFGVTGLVSFAGASGATMTSAAVSFGDLAVAGSADSVGEAQFVVDGGAVEGDELPFVLDVWDSTNTHWQFEFDFTVENRNSVYGDVTDAATTLPMEGVTVRVRGTDEAFSGQSDATGAYAVHGLGSEAYTVSVDGVSGYGTPPSQTADTTLGDVNIDFVMPPLDISYAPTSFPALVLDEGRSLTETLTITNNGISAVEIRLSAAMEEGPLDAPEAFVAPSVDWDALTEVEAVTGTMIVRFHDGIAANQINSVCGDLGATVLRRLKRIPACLVQVADGVTMAQQAQELGESPAVAYVQPNYRRQLFSDAPMRTEPNDAYYGYEFLWGLDNQGQDEGSSDADIDAPEAWSLTHGSSNVIVAILDTGCDLTHPDLVDNLWVNQGEIPGNDIDDDGNGYVDDVHGYNFLADDWTWPIWWDDPTPVDDVGHGTHVAGIIGATGNNGIGVVGVNWNVQLMILKIGDRLGVSDFAAVEALEYAIDHGARVSNCSWGGGANSAVFHDMILVGETNDHLVVCAAGNDGSNNDTTPVYPASDSAPNVLAIASIDNNGLLAVDSNYGQSYVDIAAPGVDILSTYPTNAYTELSGTSMACPHVAGVAALLAGYAPKASWSMIKEALLVSAVPDERLADKLVSGGCLNAYRALTTVGADWLGFDPETLSLAPTASSNVTVHVNENKTLLPGVYQADIVLESGATRTNLVPVDLTVNYAPFPSVESSRIDDSPSGDDDGYADQGETVSLYVTLYNRGSLALGATTGTLQSSDPSVTVDSGALSWPAMDSGQAKESSAAATLTFASGGERDVAFTLDVSDGIHADWTDLELTVHVGTRYALSGQVLAGPAGTPIEGAVVSFYGANAGTATSAADGTYRVTGLVDGTMALRAHVDGYGSPAWSDVALGGSDAVADFTLGQPAVPVLPATVLQAALAGSSNASSVSVVNAGVTDWSYTVHEMLPTEVAVFADEDRLTTVEALLSGLGFEVDGYADNLTEGYTFDAGNFMPYDICIVDLGGESGYGRKYSDQEVAVFEAYLEAGGKLILTGRNLLGSPDNQVLAELIGSESVGLQADAVSEASATGASDAALAGVYCTVDSNDVIAVTSRRYDDAVADGVSGVGLLTVGSGHKLIRNTSMVGE
ncbi:MAG: S8 family serine peptidase, partial [Verrucomicrobia bacterium]|nr:S8 family serine peptidase [Verrucomicrobiota bacterium]